MTVQDVELEGGAPTNEAEEWNPRGGETIGKSLLVEIDELEPGVHQRAMPVSRFEWEVAELVVSGAFDGEPDEQTKERLRQIVETVDAAEGD